MSRHKNIISDLRWIALKKEASISRRLRRMLKFLWLHILFRIRFFPEYILWIHPYNYQLISLRNAIRSTELLQNKGHKVQVRVWLKRKKFGTFCQTILRF